MIGINELVYLKENGVECVDLVFDGADCFSILVCALFDSAELMASKGYYDIANSRKELALSLGTLYKQMREESGNPLKTV